MTTAEYFTTWLEDKKPDLERSTYESWTIYVNRHIIPWFEKNANDLETLKARDIKSYVNYKKVSGRLDGKSGGLSPSTVRKHLSIIKQCLDSCVVDGFIPFNPALSVKLKPQKDSVSDKAVFLTRDEASTVFGFFKGHRLYPLIVITLLYGLRKSEALGLQWSSVDFQNGTISIEHTIVKSITVEEKNTTKTLGSRATFDMLPQASELLKELYKNRVKSSKYVFCWDDGRPYRPEYVLKKFQKILAKNRFKKMRFHDLRHSTCSILFDKGMELEEVKSWMRHSDIETTSNIYLHYTRERKKVVSDKVLEIMDFDL